LIHWKSFLMAEALQERGIPFVFTTGYDPSMMPEPYQSVRRFVKPAAMQEVVRTLLA
jgi:hypothetical protein